MLQSSAVNFGLLSQGEQMAIIGAFAQMLNSLSFSIQIVIHSQRLNINSYLTLLDQAQKTQTNPLLSQMMSYYRQFIQTTIKENEVLDKKFYIIIPLFAIELGLKPSKESLHQKIKTVLLPRRDQVIRQLSRVGLKATQLTNEELIELFYNLYNGPEMESTPTLSVSPSSSQVILNQPKLTPTKSPPPIPPSQPPAPTPPVSQPALQTQAAKTHPFVVEELSE